MDTHKAKDTKALSVNEEKWGKEVWGRGWVGIPAALLQAQAKLGLNAIDMLVILHLVGHWWVSKKLPYPRQSSVARSMKVDVSTVRRALRRLERKNLVASRTRRGSHGGQLSNAYDLSGLVAAVRQWVAETPKAAGSTRRGRARADSEAAKA